MKFDSRPERAFAVADLSAAYANHARQVHRGLALLDRKRLLVQDEVQADRPIDIWWFLHTAAEATLDGTGQTATLRQGSARLVARILSPAKAAFTLREAVPLPTSPHPERQGSNAKLRKLAIHLEAATNPRVAVLLEPARGPAGVGPVPELLPLPDW